MTTTEDRRHSKVIALNCDIVATARELLRVSTVRKNADLNARISRIASDAREANTLCCVEWFAHELDAA